MYSEFLYIILDYFSVLTKKEVRFEIYLPIVIALISMVPALCGMDYQYKFILKSMTFVETILGFTLAALSLLISNTTIEERTKNYPTNRKIRGNVVTAYRLMIVSFSHIIICASLLCLFFYVAALFPFVHNDICICVANTVYIIGVFHILLATIHAVTNLYFITVKG